MRIIPGVCAAFLLILTACGMPEYEERMDAQRGRLAEFDDISRMLDDPIDMSMVKKEGGKDEPLWRADFFLRLPKGYGVTPKDKTPFFDPFPCYRFANDEEGHSIFVAANLLADPKGKEKLGEYYAANFRAFVRLAIVDYYVKTSKFKLSLPEKVKSQERNVTSFSAYPKLSPKLKYDLVSYTDLSNKQATNHTQFDVYVHEAAGKQACLIVQHPLRAANADEFNKTIEACLATLDLSADAAARRVQFKRGR